MQGRLTYAGRKLQSFPENPYKEFELASKIGYDFIEFFGEKKKNYKNPIWSTNGVKKYYRLSKKTGIKIFSFCDNYIINHSISTKTTYKVIVDILNNLSNLKIKKYILPLYGSSELNKKNKNKIYENISKISKICSQKKIQLLIESDMSPIEFEKIKRNNNLKNCFFLFDTGNRVLLKSNIIKDIYKFKNNIKHIHLKDKNINNKNVIIGEGIVDFKSIFVALKNINYKGSFTIESQRGKNIKLQARKNLIFFKKLIKKYM